MSFCLPISLVTAPLRVCTTAETALYTIVSLRLILLYSVLVAQELLSCSGVDCDAWSLCTPISLHTPTSVGACQKQQIAWYTSLEVSTSYLECVLHLCRVGKLIFSSLDFAVGPSVGRA